MNSQSQNGDESFVDKRTKDLLDPSLVKSAREIYNNYRHFHVKIKKTPVGVAIDKNTHKGQLLFTDRPILLPNEYFISIEQIESKNSQTELND